MIFGCRGRRQLGAGFTAVRCSGTGPVDALSRTFSRCAIAVTSLAGLRFKPSVQSARPGLRLTACRRDHGLRLARRSPRLTLPAWSPYLRIFMPAARRTSTSAAAHALRSSSPCACFIRGSRSLDSSYPSMARSTRLRLRAPVPPAGELPPSPPEGLGTARARPVRPHPARHRRRTDMARGRRAPRPG